VIKEELVLISMANIDVPVELGTRDSTTYLPTCLKIDEQLQKTTEAVSSAC